MCYTCNMKRIESKDRRGSTTERRKGMKSNLITWGNGHKWYLKNKQQAELYAYDKSFYFDNVCLNGVKINRPL